jgi:hypothetical protein
MLASAAFSVPSEIPPPPPPPQLPPPPSLAPPPPLPPHLQPPPLQAPVETESAPDTQFFLCSTPTGMGSLSYLSMPASETAEVGQPEWLIGKWHSSWLDHECGWYCFHPACHRPFHPLWRRCHHCRCCGNTFCNVHAPVVEINATVKAGRLLTAVQKQRICAGCEELIAFGCQLQPLHHKGVYLHDL